MVYISPFIQRKLKKQLTKIASRRTTSATIINLKDAVKTDKLTKILNGTAMAPTLAVAVAPDKCPTCQSQKGFHTFYKKIICIECWASFKLTKECPGVKND